MDSGDVCRVDHHTLNAERCELIVDPEAAVACFVGTVRVGTREVTLQVAGEHFRLGGLREGFVFHMLCQNADLPGVLADVDADEQVLTGKVGFCTLRCHHKPRFVCGFGTDNPNVHNKVEAYAFLNIRSTWEPLANRWRLFYFMGLQA
jgi:hypothetical protein